MQLGTFHLSRDQVGRLLDIAMANYAMHQTPFENTATPAPDADTQA